jgi:hypothetical protein
MEHGEIQLAAGRGQQAAKKTKHYGLSTRHFDNFGLRISDCGLRIEMRHKAQGARRKAKIPLSFKP